MITSKQSGAFVEEFELEPTRPGPLLGLSFAVKDLIDVAGHKTGCGNPRWLETHPPAAVNAVVVDLLLGAGARCVGKTLTDELAFSLLGQNEHFGSPLNPRAPERISGGSSSGSASAVACGLCDMALGTDTGGSVRVPAANCGLFGLRPTHGIVSVAGVNPFAPGFDTVGLLAKNWDVMAKAAAVLLALPEKPIPLEPGGIHLVTEAFALADPELCEALAPALESLRKRPGSILHNLSLRAIDGETTSHDLMIWVETYNTLQCAEIWSTLGSWIEDAKPLFGSRTEANFLRARQVDRMGLGVALRRREQYARRLQEFLGHGNYLCIPTTPAIAPLKSREASEDSLYYPRALALTSIAGIGRLPQVTLPVAEIGGAPVGLSLLAAAGRDAHLLRVAEMVWSWVGS